MIVQAKKYNPFPLLKILLKTSTFDTLYFCNPSRINTSLQIHCIFVFLPKQHTALVYIPIFERYCSEVSLNETNGWYRLKSVRTIRFYPKICDTFLNRFVSSFWRIITSMLMQLQRQSILSLLRNDTACICFLL